MPRCSPLFSPGRAGGAGFAFGAGTGRRMASISPALASSTCTVPVSSRSGDQSSTSRSIASQGPLVSFTVMRRTVSASGKRPPSPSMPTSPPVSEVAWRSIRRRPAPVLAPTRITTSSSTISARGRPISSPAAQAAMRNGTGAGRTHMGGHQNSRSRLGCAERECRAGGTPGVSGENRSGAASWP